MATLRPTAAPKFVQTAPESAARSALPPGRPHFLRGQHASGSESNLLHSTRLWMLDKPLARRGFQRESSSRYRDTSWRRANQ